MCAKAANILYVADEEHDTIGGMPYWFDDGLDGPCECRTCRLKSLGYDVMPDEEPFYFNGDETDLVINPLVLMYYNCEFECTLTEFMMRILYPCPAFTVSDLIKHN